MCHIHQVSVWNYVLYSLSVWWNHIPYSLSVCVKWYAIFTKCLCEITCYFHSVSGEITSHSHSVSVWNDVPYSPSVCVKLCTIFTQCLVKSHPIVTQCLCEMMCHIHSVSVKLYHERLGIVACVSNWRETCDLLQWFVNKLEKLVISTLDCTWLVAYVDGGGGGGGGWTCGAPWWFVNIWRIGTDLNGCMYVSNREREKKKKRVIYHDDLWTIGTVGKFLW